MDGAVAAVAGAQRPSINDEIARLKAETAAARRAKREASKALKLAQRKRSRLMAKAKKLNDEDLMTIYELRQEARNNAAQGGGAEARKCQCFFSAGFRHWLRFRMLALELSGASQRQRPEASYPFPVLACYPHPL